MASTPDLIRARHRRRTQTQKTAQSRILRFSWGFATVFAMTLALGLIALAVAYTSLTDNLPSLETIPTLLNPASGSLLQPTRIYDRTGQIILDTLQPSAEEGQDSRQYTRLEDLPVSLHSATRASFSLASPLAVPPAFFTLFPSSPLSQSLISNLLLWDEPPSSRRDFRLALLASQLESTYGEPQVLEWYLNSAAYGHLAYGIDSAAHTYFDKSAEDLTLPEAALLAGVAQAPDLNPFDTPELALERRQSILQSMLEAGMIGPEDAQRAREAPLGVLNAPSNLPTRDSAFLNLVFEEITPEIPRARLEQGGLMIITTLDASLQSEISCAIETQLARVTGQPNGPADLPAPQTDSASLPGCETARLLPTVSLDASLETNGLSAQGVVLDPRTAQILALTGRSGTEYFTRVDHHAPGTLLTPYVYLTAFTRGFSPASLVWDIPANLPPTLGLNPNPDGEYHGPQRMRLALANDYLVPTLDLLRELGPENVWKTATQLGLPSLSAPAGNAALHLPLEGGNLTILEMAQAYGVFGSQGILFGYGRTGEPGTPLLPTAILRVEDLSGHIWYDPGTPDARPVISAQLAYLITHILSDETARWPSLGHPNALEIGRPAGVKLGYTGQGTDTWAIGFTPQLVTAVWAGVNPAPTGETPVPSDRIPTSIAAALWHGITKYATRNLPPESWATPPGISTIDVCDPSGQLPTTDCPLIVKEIFTPGSEPTQVDTLYRRIQINRETGLLATVFTLPALIEERVYLIPPADAADWAREAGLPIPPETYDLVSAPGANPDARFNAPEMFASVGGRVTIQGTASGTDFQSYQVQIGQGLNPQQWILLGEQSSDPVEDGNLAIWDTAGLSGLYAIRLLVIRADQRIDTAILQVTVDNTPPSVEIIYPGADQVFTSSQTDSITFQIQAEDNLTLKRVEIYLDEKLRETISQPPFVYRWNATPGEYVLTVRAVDVAGNVGETSVMFIVQR